MKKNKIRFKDVTKLNDVAIGEIVREAVSYIVSTDGYFPYFRERGVKSAIIKYLMMGLTFEDGDDKENLIYTDKTIAEKYKVFREENCDFICLIEDYVDAVASYEKRKSIYQSQELNSKLLEIIDIQKAFENLRIEVLKKENQALTQQIRANEYQEQILERMTPDEVAQLNKVMASGEYNMEQLSDYMMKKYLGSDYHANKMNEIIDAKNAEIVELKKYKQEQEARNVLADK